METGIVLNWADEQRGHPPRVDFIGHSMFGAALPTAIWARLQAFQEAHPPRKHKAAGRAWQVISAGGGPETVVLLADAFNVGETLFDYAAALAAHYHVILPTLPAAGLADMTSGLAAVLRGEGVRRAHVFGTGMGGMVAQAFARQYPEQVDKLILSHTTAPGCLLPAAQRAQWTAWLEGQIALLRHVPARLLAWGEDLHTAHHCVPHTPDGQRFWWQACYPALLDAAYVKSWILAHYGVMLEFLTQDGVSPGDWPHDPCRVLLIESADDDTHPAPVRAALRRMYPAASVQTFTGCKGLTVYQRPHRLLPLIEGFLRLRHSNRAERSTSAGFVMV